MAALEIDNLGIPPLAGICTYEEASKSGYTVEQTVDLLKRYNYIKVSLNKLLAAHLAHTPEWEVKCALSQHLWLEAEHSTWLRKRVTEMREPPHYLDEVPDEKLEAFFEELIRSKTTVELLAGVYGVLKPAMIEALKIHLAQTNALIDYPTCRLLRFILSEEEEMLKWGKQALIALTRVPEALQEARDWERHVNWFLAAAGGIAGNQPAREDLSTPFPRFDGTAYQVESTPRRDQRFHDPFNRSAKIDEYYQEETRDGEERVCALLYKRLREIDVPEWMGPIIFKTTGQPWDYYRDLSRQLWDEARHAMMGEIGLYAKGVAFYRYPIDIASSFSLNQEYEPLEAHLILWGIEQSLMPRETGKRWEWEIAAAANEPLAVQFQDYDWADEVLHAQIGRKWLLPHFGNRQIMLIAWEELMQRWSSSRDALVTRSEQKEWWPDFMADVRRQHLTHVS